VFELNVGKPSLGRSPTMCRISKEFDRMTAVRLAAESRDAFGKGAARRTRRDGRVPAVVYGHGTGLRHVSLDAHALGQALRKAGVILEIELDGAVIVTAPRDVQRDPVRRVIEHIDLVIIDAGEQADRENNAQAVAEAIEAAEEAGLDSTAVAAAAVAAVEAGESVHDAVAHAVHDVEASMEANTEANAAAEAAEEAAAPEAAPSA